MDTLSVHLLESIALTNHGVWWRMAIGVSAFGKWTLDPLVQQRGRVAFTCEETTKCENGRKYKKILAGKTIENTRVFYDVDDNATIYRCNVIGYSGVFMYMYSEHNRIDVHHVYDQISLIDREIYVSVTVRVECGRSKLVCSTYENKKLIQAYLHEGVKFCDDGFLPVDVSYLFPPFSWFDIDRVRAEITARIKKAFGI